ncbi:MAG: bifunctional diguanylate cyclase/phosphodiesterase, partial [Novosphingobium sp.]|nr:bifunctional diguanylate cyclase/phosphodiesterase [Novosphingobium sp.]
VRGDLIGILILDLDGFKQVNDTMGHDAGDAMLCTVANRLEQFAGPDVICARLAGDEFAVIARAIRSGDDLVNLGMAVLEKLKQPFMHADHMLDGHASIGAAVWPLDGKTVSELLKSADLALYAAKRDRPGTVQRFIPEHRRELRARTTMLRRAREALRRNAVQPFYQPIIAIDQGTIAGYEALMRLRRPGSRAVLHPSAVLAAFAAPELAKALGEDMIRAIAADMARWLDAGVVFGRVAVNASAADLRHDDYAEKLLSALEKVQVTPSLLKLEVTETVFLGRSATNVRRTIEKLCAHGIDIVLDDFGTGYSSLGYLREFRFSTIKVDRTFVQGAAQKNPESLAIIRAVIAMAESLDMSTTAEGVETERELKIVRELGCRKIQGYYFGRPMEARDVQKLFRQRGQPQKTGAAA